MSKFPTHENREFFAPLQGIKSADQGNFSADQGNPRSCAFGSGARWLKRTTRRRLTPSPVRRIRSPIRRQRRVHPSRNRGLHRRAREMPRQTARGGSPANELTGHERMDIKGSVSLARGRMHSLVSSIAVVSHSRCRRRVLCVHTALSHPPSEAADRFQPDAGRVSLFSWSASNPDSRPRSMSPGRSRWATPSSTTF